MNRITEKFLMASTINSDISINTNSYLRWRLGPQRITTKRVILEDEKSLSCIKAFSHNFVV